MDRSQSAPERTERTLLYRLPVQRCNNTSTFRAAVPVPKGYHSAIVLGTLHQPDDVVRTVTMKFYQHVGGQVSWKGGNLASSGCTLVFSTVTPETHASGIVQFPLATHLLEIEANTASTGQTTLEVHVLLLKW
jgi:hypothetical protein